MNIRPNNLMLQFFTAVLIAVIIGLGYFVRPSFVPFSLLIQKNGSQQIIDTWENEENYIYAFLPSGVNLEDVLLKKQTNEDVILDGQPVAQYVDCGAFALNVPYEVTYRTFAKQRNKTLIFLQSVGVPTLFISTASEEMECLHSDKENKENCSVSLYSADGGLVYDGLMGSISGRGNYTWDNFEKKSYSVSLTQEADFRGMGQASEWILLSNASDPSHLRNKIVYDFAHAVGMDFTPDSQWVSLYLNGEYVGLYLLCERNEVHENRVAISQEGSFLVSLELEDRLLSRNIDYVKTNANLTLRIHFPESITAQDLTHLGEKWQNLEDAITSDDGISPTTGQSYLDLIDLDSWARKYLIEEIFGNLDACFLSQYFYFKRNTGDQKIYAGPVWDYDLSMGNDREWQMMNPNSLFANRLWVKEGIQTPWFYELCQKSEFWTYVVSLYRNEYLPLLETYISVAITDYGQQTMQAAAVDEIRWAETSLKHTEYIEQLVTYLNERIDFLNGYFFEEDEYRVVRIDAARNGNMAYWLVETGELLPELPVLKSTPSTMFLGWYDESTDTPFDPEQQISEDMDIVAKWEEKEQGNVKMMGKLIPLGMIAVMGVILAVIELRRWRKYR